MKFQYMDYKSSSELNGREISTHSDQHDFKTIVTFDEDFKVLHFILMRGESVLLDLDQNEYQMFACAWGTSNQFLFGERHKKRKGV